MFAFIPCGSDNNSQVNNIIRIKMFAFIPCGSDNNSQPTSYMSKCLLSYPVDQIITAKLTTSYVSKCLLSYPVDQIITANQHHTYQNVCFHTLTITVPGIREDPGDVSRQRGGGGGEGAELAQCHSQTVQTAGGGLRSKGVRDG